MKIKIKEVCDRKVLGEGRSSGMGFAFLKKKNEGEFETVQPVSPCKDYLAEVVFTELTGIGTQGCGLSYPKKLDIQDKEYFYLTIQIQKKKDGSYHHYSTYEADCKNLKDNYLNIQAFINKIEDLLNFTNKTTILDANDGYFLINVPKGWCISTIMISMYTLLIRCAQAYNGKQDINEFMDELSTNLKNIDGPLLKTALSRIKQILESKTLVEQPKEHLESINKHSYWSPHNEGICSMKIESKTSILA